MKNLTLLLLLFITFSSLAQEYHIKAIDVNLEDGTMVLLGNMEGIKPYDTVYVKNNTFEFKGKVAKSNLFYLCTTPYNKEQANTFFVENTITESSSV